MHHQSSHHHSSNSSHDSYFTYSHISSNGSHLMHNHNTYNHGSRNHMEHESRSSLHEQLPPMSTFVGNDFSELVIQNSELESASLDCTLVDQSLVDVLTSQFGDDDFDPSSYLNDPQSMSTHVSETSDTYAYGESAAPLNHHDLSFTSSQTSHNYGIPINTQSSTVGDIFSVFGLPDSEVLSETILNVNDHYCTTEANVIASQQTISPNSLISLSQQQLHGSIQIDMNNISASNVVTTNVGTNVGANCHSHLQITPIVIPRAAIQTNQSYVTQQSNQQIVSSRKSQNIVSAHLKTPLTVPTESPKKVIHDKSYTPIVQNGLDSHDESIDNIPETNDLIEETKCFKCKLCDYIDLEKCSVLSHITEKHNVDNENVETLNGKKSNEKGMIENDKKSNTYVCCKCYHVFLTLTACRQHMVNLHNLKVDHITLKVIKDPITESPQLSNNVNNNNPSAVKSAAKLRHILPIQCQEQTAAIPKKSKQNHVASKVHHNNNNNSNVSLNHHNNNQHHANHVTSKKIAWKKKIKREQGTYICEFKGCSVRFRALENLQCHHKCHSDSGSGFVCLNCNYKSEQWSSMAGHLWRNHGIDLELHSCEHCPYRTYSLSLLENVHKRIHGEEKNFLCDICGKGFKNCKQLINHKVKHTVKTEIVKLHECHICGRTFTDARTMKVHLSTVHNKTRPYICSQCNYSASSRSALRTHMRSHTGEKPFQCDKCAYSTSDHNSLRRHKMRHSGERPYKCPFCSYACIQSSTYKQHLKNKHPGQNEGLMFTCHECVFKTVNQDMYHTHISEHNRSNNDQHETITNGEHILVKKEDSAAILIAPESPNLQFACIVGQSISSQDNTLNNH